MFKSIVQNTKYLNAIAGIIKNEESKQVANEIIKLYKNRNITNIATVEKLINKLSSKNKKSRESAIKTYNENKSNWETHNTKNPEIIERREKASAMITKLFKQGVNFTAETTQTAMTGKVEKVKTTAKYVGPHAKLRKLLYASLKQALNVRKSKNKKFQVYAKMDINTDGVLRPINSGKFDEKHMLDMVDAMLDKIEGVSSNYEDVNINRTYIEYGFVDTPSGGCYVEDEKLNGILFRKSVMAVRNSDNNCFWYCMLYLQSDDRNIKYWDARQKN